MRILRGWTLCLLLASFLFSATLSLASVVEVVGYAESKIKSSHAFSGLRVTIECKVDNGHFVTKGSGNIDDKGKFNLNVPHDIVSDGGALKEECYAQLHSAMGTPCPAHESIESNKIVVLAKTGDKHVLGLKQNLKFSPEICVSKFFWPKPKLPPFKGFDHPLPPPLELPPFKKPFPPPVPVYEPPPKVELPPVHEPPPKVELPPPVPVYKPPPKVELPPPVPEKPCPPKAPKIELPPPVPIYKPPPKIEQPPPVPVYKPPPKIEQPPPVPVYQPPPKIEPPPIYKPPVVIPKKPCPPLPKFPPIPPKYIPHPKFGKWPPLPPHH